MRWHDGNRWIGWEADPGVRLAPNAVVPGYLADTRMQMMWMAPAHGI